MGHDSLVQEWFIHFAGETAGELPSAAGQEMVAVEERLLGHPATGVDHGKMVFLGQTSKIRIDFLSCSRRIPAAKVLPLRHEQQHGLDLPAPANVENLV